MSPFSVDPDRARILADELLDAASRIPGPPLPRPGAVARPGRFTESLNRALNHLDDQTRRVHDRARELAERSRRAVEAAEHADDSLARHLGRL